ncbi:HlyD family secretion protein [Paraburkholderia megapolitana]|uniref:Membrane fusion protein, multidrug efflux system n=1 Tax=Paraburkholderia megapolitana TaxID=420953 RepID=A0A1I3T7A1_9BURK|nr:HlyD family secretion protein [Paraburkholderia megapolitana]QDQ81413.1 HlyD family secretion protein [Paraburkholderia megapolitana]SFJ65397.1 membrane fusion protein, multidrug efflux system [Paraburkholderia megapolitana]
MATDHTEIGGQTAGAAAPNEQPGAPGNGTSPARKPGGKGVLIAIVIACILLVVGGWYYFSTRNTETTDDAQVDGNAVTVAPKVAGYVVTLAIRDNQRVKAGDLLIKIDPRDYIAARDQAEASLEVARAQLENAQVNLTVTRVSAPAKLVQAKAQVAQASANQVLAAADDRRQTTLDARATTQAARDQASAQLRSAAATLTNNQAQVDIAKLIPETVAQAQAQVDQANAQVRQAQAQLEAAQLNLSYTEIRAPQDGWVTLRNVQLGSYVQAGQSLFSLVAPDVWITANFKENQLGRMRVGQKVSIRVDAYGQLRLKGHIDSIQQGTGSRFSAFPAENATGNFVKIVQRIPVKIVIDSGLDANLPLPLGASVDPEVDLQ